MKNNRIEFDLDIKNLSLMELYSLMDQASEEFTNRTRGMWDDLKILNEKENEILHEIETSRFNAINGFKYARGLRELRRVRRVVKNDTWFFAKLKEVNLNMREVENKLSLARNEYFSSKECREHQKAYGQYEELGALNQDTVNQFVNDLLNPVDEQSVKDLADKFNGVISERSEDIA